MTAENDLKRKILDVLIELKIADINTIPIDFFKSEDVAYKKILNQFNDARLVSAS